MRQLYTDDDEVLFRAARPLLVNGIEDVITRPDLADRARLADLALPARPVLRLKATARVEALPGSIATPPTKRSVSALSRLTVRVTARLRPAVSLAVAAKVS